MGFAEEADVPVILVGDIDRGGVIASLVGTHAVLEPSEKQRIKGFLINKFRGDTQLFADGMDMISERTGWQGLVFFHGLGRRRVYQLKISLIWKIKPASPAWIIAVMLLFR